IHAARALAADLGRRQRMGELLPGLQPRLDLVVRPLLALDFEKALYEAHNLVRSPTPSLRRHCLRRRPFARLQEGALVVPRHYLDEAGPRAIPILQQSARLSAAGM